MSKYKQGTYKVKNKDKYIGTKDPRYMSSWEYDVMVYLDSNPNIIKWGSEVITVPYYSTMDQKKRRYMVDFYVEYIKSGKKVVELIECKPYCQTQKPTKRGRKKKETYLREIYTYNVNLDKWKAAAEYARQRKWEFRLLTENQIYK